MRLTHSRPTDPGYRRLRHGRGFRYLDTRGEPLRDRDELNRIRALVIPPAWRDVWICAKPNGPCTTRGSGPNRSRPSTSTCSTSPRPCPPCATPSRNTWAAGD